jgi:hypothetical protein
VLDERFLGKRSPPSISSTPYPLSNACSCFYLRVMLFFLSAFTCVLCFSSSAFTRVLCFSHLLFNRYTFSSTYFSEGSPGRSVLGIYGFRSCAAGWPATWHQSFYEHGNFFFSIEGMRGTRHKLIWNISLGGWYAPAQYGDIWREH